MIQINSHLEVGYRGNKPPLLPRTLLPCSLIPTFVSHISGPYSSIWLCSCFSVFSSILPSNCFFKHVCRQQVLSLCGITSSRNGLYKGKVMLTERSCVLSGNHGAIFSFLHPLSAYWCRPFQQEVSCTNITWQGQDRVVVACLACHQCPTLPRSCRLRCG